MPQLIFLVFVLLSVTLLLALFRAIKPKRVLILQYQRGLLFHRGLLARVLGPGVHWTTVNSVITLVDTRLQVLQVPGQEILTADGITLKISLAGEYTIADPERFLTVSTSAVSSLYVYAQQALRAATAEQTFQVILATRPSLNLRIADQLRPQALSLGLELSSIEIRDLMLPSDLKRAFAEAATAGQQGLAALERARSETASLRSLANAARLLEQQPALLQLRAIQAAESSRGNTLVLGVPATSVITPGDRPT